MFLKFLVLIQLNISVPGPCHIYFLSLYSPLAVRHSILPRLCVLPVIVYVFMIGLNKVKDTQVDSTVVLGILFSIVKSLWCFIAVGITVL